MTNVIKGKQNGFIHGQPATGRSIMTLFTGCYLRFDWNIIWLRIAPDSSVVSVVIIQGSCMRKCSISCNELTMMHVAELVEYSGGNSQTILIIDDVNMDVISHRSLVITARLWREGDSGNRRLVCISSMVNISMLHYKDLMRFTIHGVGSWSLGEYLEAVENDEVWASVKHAFIPNDLRPRSNQVISKFYYAGTCARFMFEFSIPRIIGTFSTIVVSLYPRCMRPFALGNAHLFSWSNGISLMDYTGFVSQFAARRVASCGGSQFIQEFYNTVRTINRETREWTFDAYLQALVSVEKQLVSKCLSRQTMIDLRFPGGSQSFDREYFEEIKIDEWLHPDSPCGFNAVSLDSTGTVRFMLTTLENNYVLEMKDLTSVVVRLLEKQYKVRNAEIFVFIPDSPNSRDFRIRRIRDWENFSESFNSWHMGSEDKVRERLTVVALDI